MFSGRDAAERRDNNAESCFFFLSVFVTEFSNLARCTTVGMICHVSQLVIVCVCVCVNVCVCGRMRERERERERECLVIKSNMSLA